MAARVNVKFVIVLSVALVAVMAAVVFAAMTVVLKSGEDYAARAVEFEQTGEYKKAANSWERAVGHDRTRLDWLEGWRQTLKKVEYDTEAEYLSDTRMHLGILRTVAEVKGSDIDAYREYLDELTYTTQATGAGVAVYNNTASEVERSLLAFPDSMTAERGQIRRYRGIIGALALVRGVELDDDEVTLLREDLLAALAGDPGDEDAIAAIVRIDAVRADEAERDRRGEDATQIWQELSQIVDGFVDSNPDSIRGRIHQTNIAIGSALSDIKELGLFGADQNQAVMDAILAYEDTARSIYEDYMQAPPERTSHVAGTELTALLARVLRGDRTDRVVDIWNHTLGHHPEDVLVIQSRAHFLQTVSRYQEAIDSYQEILDLPRPPVSAAGELLIILKKQAGIAMGSCAYEQWYTRTTNASRLPSGSEERAAMLTTADEALENAKTYRDQAQQDLAEDEPGLVLLNAKIAFADGNIPAADILARRYNESTSEFDAEGLRLAADIARRLNNSGEQRRLLERLLDVNPTDVRGMLDLAEVQIELREYGEAERLLTIASELRPDLDAIGNRLAMISAVLGNTKIEDPFEAAIVNAQLALDEGDAPRAIDILQTALDTNPAPDHIRVHTVLASTLLGAGDAERAARVADAGLAIDPASRSLQIIKRQAEIGDDIEAAIAFVRSQDTLSETEKNLRVHRLYVSGDQIEAAQAPLRAAREASPDDPDVLRAAFDFALRTGALDDARAIIAQTQGRDIDGANGLALRARLNIAEGEYEEAERTLSAAVERGSLNANTLSLLGRVQTLRGNTAASIESFRRAREIRPGDISFTNDYIRALASSGRETAALDAAREALQIGRTDRDFTDLWLALEGTIGSKQVAYDERLAISQTRPDDDTNTAALIRLSLDLRRFDEARDRLDQARAERDTLALCQLDALWHMQRGDFNAAADQYNQFLVSDAEGADSAAAYIAYGNFLIDNGQLDAGLRTLRQGRRLQPDDNPVVDLELARRLFAARRYAEAAETLEPILTGPASESAVAEQARPTLIETYVRLGEWDAAQGRLDELTPDQRDGLTMRLLQSEVSRGRGEADEARRLLDDTITAYPEEPMPYLRRGTLLMVDQTLLSDALEDLTRAIEFDPANPDAFRFRAMAYTAMGRESEATADIIAATRARPLDDQIRLAAATRLVEMGREDLAADVIDEGLERQAGNLRLLFNAGRIFAGAESHLKAVQYFEQAWDQSRDASIAGPLIASMLEIPRPDLRAARQIASDSALDQESPSVLMMRARIESAGDNTGATESLLTEAYLASRDNPQVLVPWAQSLETLLGDRDSALDYLTRLDARESLSPWGRFAQANVLAQADDGRSQARQILASLINASPEGPLKLAAIRLRSIANYQDGEHQAAIDDIRAGLAIAPDDPEFNNNIAYILSVELDQSAEALPHAQRAVELAPENRGYLDTLGTVYVRAGEPEKAIAPLERALMLATTDPERAPVLVHLAEARLATGNRPGAEDAANEARDILESLDDPNENTQAELQRVLDDLNSPR